MNEVRKGKLIVIEGGDGSGKGTQAQLLLEHCRQNDLAHAYYDFPNYDSFFGQMVGAFLRGDYGSLETVSPYIASLLFALDRREMKSQIERDLQDGKLVVMNRYITSNIAHQGSKFTDENERKQFIDWLSKLEYEIHDLPHEDLIILLDVPWSTAQVLTQQKNQRGYLNGAKEDIQEKNLDHRKQTEEMYHLLASQNPHWTIVRCLENKSMRNKQEIHQEILDVLKKHHIL
jgi:dTMP kinase